MKSSSVTTTCYQKSLSAWISIWRYLSKVTVFKMAQVEDIINTHTHQKNTTPLNLPKDLFKRFMASNNRHHHHRLPLPLPPNSNLYSPTSDHEEEEELELTLGLSLNGRFGVDPTAAKKIKRTTSMIPELPNAVRDEEMGGFMVPAAAVVCSPLVRTCSLPTETEEEWRKRKELQTMRRMEARKKRSEKQRNLKAMRERNRGLSEENDGGGISNDGGGGSSNDGGLRRTTSLTTRVGGLGLNEDIIKEKGIVLVLPLVPVSLPQGSIGSSSESESLQGQGVTPMDTSSPVNTNLFPDQQMVPPRAGVTDSSGKVAAAGTMKILPNQHSAPQNRTRDIVRNILEDMPSVSTKGEGPNGKKIKGFLYKYGKGEEVRILCVCHGSFHTPAEFVKHAGGADVANPLKHIVVSPSSM